MEKDGLKQNSKKVQSATDLPTSEDKAIEISDKRKSMEQSANDVYFIKKIKAHRVRNGQKEFFINHFTHNVEKWSYFKNLAV